MCFGAKAMPGTDFAYRRPRKNPLPSLKMDEKIEREGAKYMDLPVEKTQRSLLMPMGMNNG